MKYIIITFIIGLSLLNMNEQKAEKTFTLTVTVNNVKDSSGSVGLALFNDSDEFPDGEIFRAEGKSAKSAGSMEIVIEDLPAGDYAIAALHDANENEDIDVNEQGMPTEGFGFSNNAMGDMGPPDFEEAAFTLDEDMAIEINLIYLFGRNQGK